jgi:formylglycine-generating enzyme required for sulfatase activity
MSATEVTVYQFGLYCALSGNRDIRYYMAWPNSGDHPVVNVSWYDAVEYSNWLSERRGVKVMYKIDKDIVDPNNQSVFDGLKWTVEINSGVGGYRLPTESEWEYAARGGSKSKGSVYAGGDSLALVGWYYANSGSRTRAVGQKKPNELGLYDMSGNVWEWCWDWYGSYSADEQVNPRGAETGDYRVNRGGSWFSAPQYCRAANRGIIQPSIRDNALGFRLVSSLQ